VKRRAKKALNDHIIGHEFVTVKQKAAEPLTIMINNTAINERRATAETSAATAAASYATDEAPSQPSTPPAHT
jgi:hypothetical protein